MITASTSRAAGTLDYPKSHRSLRTKRKFGHAPSKTCVLDQSLFPGLPCATKSLTDRCRGAFPYMSSSAACSATSFSDSAESGESATDSKESEGSLASTHVVQLPLSSDIVTSVRIRPLPPIPILPAKSKPEQLPFPSSDASSSSEDSHSSHFSLEFQSEHNSARPKQHPRSQSPESLALPTLYTFKTSFGPRPPKSKLNRRSLSVDSPYASLLSARMVETQAPSALPHVPLVLVRTAPPTTTPSTFDKELESENEWNGEWSVKDAARRAALLRSLRR